MKKVYNKTFDMEILEPETCLEAVEHLQEFFEADMWYTQDNEWKSERDMLKYLQGHFKICKDSIKRLEK